MKYLPLIWAGLWRKKTRTILTFLSVVVAFILFGILAGVTGALDEMLGTSRMDRMFADPKFGDPLPVTYLAQIAAVPGVKLVAPRMRMVGYFKDPKNSLGVITTDTRFFAVRPEIQIKPADIDAWEKDRQGAVVDANWARKFGWKVGDKIPLVSPIPTKDGSKLWTFDIIAIVTDATTTDSAWFLANYRYLDDRRATGSGKVDRFLIVISDPRKGAQIAQAIDKQFVNSPFPTRSGSERATFESNDRSLGDIDFLTHAVIVAVLFMLLFLTGNTMMQSVRERIPEFAVMKTMGFSDGAVLSRVLAEVVLPRLLAGFAGLLLVKLFLPVIVADHPRSFISLMVLPWRSVGWGLFFALATAAIAVFVPAMKVRRLSVVDSLRH